LATLKELRLRIHGVKGTQKITRAMKMVASAKLRRAQDKILATRPYASKISELLNNLASAAEEGIDELLIERPVSRRLVVIVSADRGLAGSFNSNLIRNAYQHIQELGTDTKVIIVGKKANDSLKKRNLRLVNSYIGIFADLNIEKSNEIVDFIVDGYKKREYDLVEIIYNEFKSISRQVVVREQFLPLKKAAASNEDKKKFKAFDYIYEPSAAELIKSLIPRHLRVQFWKVLLESNAAEQAARMTAMETATKNAADLLQILELNYNQARQAAITKELLEIVAGAEALKEA